MDTNITKNWKIEIIEDEVFARCTNESLYQAYIRTKENPKGDAIVMQEDDRPVFSVYFDNAIAHLHMLLARRMNEPKYGTETGDAGAGKRITFNLKMHDNHDDNVYPMLATHCYDYVVKKVLEQWYHADFGSESERWEINHCIHYRKNPVRRRVSPLI